MKIISHSVQCNQIRFVSAIVYVKVEIPIFLNDERYILALNKDLNTLVGLLYDRQAGFVL